MDAAARKNIRLNRHCKTATHMPHKNVHVPSESWPRWTWFAIEFGIVLAVSMLASREVVNHLINTMGEIPPDIQNWVFYGCVGGIFLGWYLILRTLVFKRPILGNRHA